MTWDHRRAEYLHGIAATIILFLVPANGQIPGPTKCPAVTLATGTSPSLLSKTWYEARRYFTEDKAIPSCVTYTFGTPNEMTNELTLEITEKYPSEQAMSCLQGVLRPKIEFSSYDVLVPLRKFLSDFNILGFDPNGEWIALWTCNDFGIFHIQQALVLTSSRDSATLESSVNQAIEVFKANNIPYWLLKVTDQDEC